MVENTLKIRQPELRAIKSSNTNIFLEFLYNTVKTEP